MLLIGMAAVSLMPRFLCTLPSGVAVFRSALKDKYNSNLIFAGPHMAFASHADLLHSDVLSAYAVAPSRMPSQRRRAEAPPQYSYDGKRLMTERMLKRRRNRENRRLRELASSRQYH